MNFAGEAYLDDKSIGRHGGRPSKGNAKSSEPEGRAPSRPLRLDDNPLDDTEVVPPEKQKRGRVSPAAF